MYKLTGRLTRDAQVQETSTGKTVVNFSLAENIRVGKGDTAKEITQYYECSYWISDKVAKILTQGKLVELQGYFKAKAYNNKEGKAVPVMGFTTTTIKVLASAKTGLVNNRTQKTVATTEQDAIAEDLPF